MIGVSPCAKHSVTAIILYLWFYCIENRPELQYDGTEKLLPDFCVG